MINVNASEPPEKDLSEPLAENQVPQAEEVSLYIHIPFCISKCSYCDFFSKSYNSSELEPVIKRYVKALCNELAFRLAKYKVGKIKTLYIGGGTPSLLSTEDFKKILDSCPSEVPPVEITVEVNPDDLTFDLLSGLEECGVSRISCGIQSMNDEALKKACRRADAKTNRKALELLKKYWKGDLSLDLISGLPLDNEKTLLNSLEELCDGKAEHISLYSLTIEDNTPFGKELAAGKLRYNFDEADKLWIAGRNFLEKAGYQWYEVSNFCKSGKECLHNLVYWSHGGYLGCGAGACGSLYYKDGSGFRWTNTRDIEKYISYWEGRCFAERGLSQLPQLFETIDLETSKFEFFMMGLRKIKGITDRDFKRIFNEDLPEKFLQLFKEEEAKGFARRCRLSDGAVEYAMSREGILFLNPFLEKLC